MYVLIVSTVQHSVAPMAVQLEGLPSACSRFGSTSGLLPDRSAARMAAGDENFVGFAQINLAKPPTYFRSTEPTAKEVIDLANIRASMPVDSLINNTLALAQVHPLMLLRVRDYEQRLQTLSRKRQRAKGSYQNKKGAGARLEVD
jgi:hypothetical protein